MAAMSCKNSKSKSEPDEEEEESQSMDAIKQGIAARHTLIVHGYFRRWYSNKNQLLVPTPIIGIVMTYYYVPFPNFHCFKWCQHKANLENQHLIETEPQPSGSTFAISASGWKTGRHELVVRLKQKPTRSFSIGVLSYDSRIFGNNSVTWLFDDPLCHLSYQLFSVCEAALSQQDHEANGFYVHAKGVNTLV